MDCRSVQLSDEPAVFVVVDGFGLAADAHRVAGAEVAEDLSAEVLAAEHALDLPGAAVGPVDAGGAGAVLVAAEVRALEIDLDVDALVHGRDAVGSGEAVAAGDGHAGGPIVWRTDVLSS